MAKRPEGITTEQWSELRDAFAKFGQVLGQRMEEIMEAITPAVTTIYNGVWEEYRKAGAPFGETEEGMLRWVTLMGEMRMHEEKAAQIRSDLIGYAEFRQKVLASRALEEAHDATER